MRITRLTLKNIGPFDDVAFEVPEVSGEGEVVLFEGPNGCGKTTITEVIATALTTAREPGELSAFVSGVFSRLGLAPKDEERAQLDAMIGEVDASDAFKYRGVAGGIVDAPSRSVRARMRTPAVGLLDVATAETKLVLSLAAAEAGAESLYLTASPPQAEIAALTRTKVESQRWAAFAYRAHHPTAVTNTRGPKPLQFDPRRGALSFAADESQSASNLLGQELVNLEYDRVRAETYAREQPVNEEFSLAAVTNREAIERLAHGLSRVIDRRVEIRFPFHQTAPQVLFDGEEVPIELLGEGLRSTVSWLADLLVRLRHTPWEDRARSPFDQEFWLILDEVDQGLHPQLQMRLYPALRELFPRARIYGTTHSPFVVASLGDGDGVVFPIRPDPKTHRVTGPVPAWPFRHGNSLTAVIEEVFATPADFIDPETREALQRHRDAVDRLRRGEPIDEPRFVDDRRFLLGLTEEVATTVAMREAIAPRKVQAVVERAPPRREAPEGAE